MTRCANAAKIMSIMANVLALGSVVIYMIQRAFQIISAEINGLERTYVMQSLFPQIFKVTPYYQILCLIQTVATFMLTANYVNIDSMIYMLVFNICSQFQILRKELNKAIDSMEDQQCPDDFQEVIRIIVLKHENLNQCVRKIEDCFNVCFLVQALLTTLLICFQAFLTFEAVAVSDSFPVNDIFFLIIFIFVILNCIYFFCFMGEALTVSSSALSNGVFESNWYSLSPRNLKMLTFIVFRSRTPLFFTTGKFNILSMETFGNIVKAAAGYFSVMVQLEAGMQQQTD